DPPRQLEEDAARLVDVGHGVVGGAVAAQAVLDDRAVVVPGGPPGDGRGRDPGIARPGQGDDEVPDGREGVGVGHALEGSADRDAGRDEGVRVLRGGALAPGHDLDVAVRGGVEGHVVAAVGGGPAVAPVPGDREAVPAAAARRALGAVDAVVGGGELGRGGGGGRRRRRGARRAPGGVDLAAVLAAPDDGHGAGGADGHRRRGGQQRAAAPAAPAPLAPVAPFVERDRFGAAAGGAGGAGGLGGGGGVLAGGGPPGEHGRVGDGGEAPVEAAPEVRAVIGHRTVGQGGAQALVALGVHRVSPSLRAARSAALARDRREATVPAATPSTAAAAS